MVPLSIWEAFKPMHEAVKWSPCEKCDRTYTKLVGLYTRTQIQNETTDASKASEAAGTADLGDAVCRTWPLCGMKYVQVWFKFEPVKTKVVGRKDHDRRVVRAAASVSRLPPAALQG